MPRLGRAARELVTGALRAGELLISAISFCEVAWLHRAGRLVLPASPLSWRASVLVEGVREIPSTVRSPSLPLSCRTSTRIRPIG